MVHPLSVIIFSLCIIVWVFIAHWRYNKIDNSYVTTDNILKDVIPKQKSWDQIFDKLNRSSASLKWLSIESNQSLYSQSPQLFNDESIKRSIGNEIRKNFYEKINQS